MAMGIDGLASGLDTTALINQLMQVEAMPQTLLKVKSSQTQSLVSGLQALNTKIASLAEVAATTAKVESWSTWKAASSASSATVVAGSSAQAGSISFSIDAVATAQVSLTDAFLDDNTMLPAIPPALTIKKFDGTLVTVNPTTGSLADIAKAINDDATTGVKATVVQVVGGATPQYKLQLTGSSTGTDKTFEVYRGTDASGLRLDTSQVTAATNAELTLWKGSASELVLNQSANTFVGLMTGVDVTVSKVTGATEDPVTISVVRDDSALKKLTSGLVGALGVVFSEIASRTAITTKANADGTTTVTGGLFTGDSAVRAANELLLTAASAPVGDDSPYAVGIELGRDGSFTFDEVVFAAALAADPAKVQSIVTQIAARVAEAATSVSDKYEGTLTLKITGQESLVKDMGTQIESWDRRLELRREGLQRTYSALEVSMQSLQAQSSWLTSQLANLPTYS
ncbi:flagellar filament capping protein FliD [Cellulomonas sp. KRMCY2]|uniref:flagellar filament capping protein FliD n=1 Tax=Cellulomonas sp. KRMCY2 TaxID=1304865 RepID=UPI00045E6D07|nr:flagellar filament capping protein FliD [Cellulomonas sp. KRMCY2]